MFSPILLCPKSGKRRKKDQRNYGCPSFSGEGVGANGGVVKRLMT
jgi:hypothetical protein